MQLLSRFAAAGWRCRHLHGSTLSSGSATEPLANRILDDLEQGDPRLMHAQQETTRHSRAVVGSTAVIADAYPLWLRAVESVLDGLGVKTVGATTTPEEGIELIALNRPDILVTDLDFGIEGAEGADFVRHALEVQPDLRVIVLTMHKESSMVEDAIAAGAAVYVVKTVTPGDLASAVRQTFDHSVFFAPREALEAADRTASHATPVVRRLDLALDASTTLTKREREILDLVAEGHPNAEIGRRLWITEQTVKFHLSNIYRKLGVSNRTQASQWTHRHWRDQDPAVGA
jgi:DNA-binding NarL/FixJ family response regulator